MKRVVITGMSLVSSLGHTPDDAYNRLHTFENCVEYQPDLEVYDKLTTKLAARIKDFKMDIIQKDDDNLKDYVIFNFPNFSNFLFNMKIL